MSNTDKATFLATLQQGREQWEALLVRVPAARMQEPGAAGIWSVKDVIAHIGVYEHWTADQVEAVLRGEQEAPPDPRATPEIEAMTMDERNDYFYRLARSRSLADVVADEAQDYQRLLAALQALPAADYASANYSWTGGQMIGDALVGNTFGHFEEHTPWLEAFLQGEGQA